MRTLGLAAFPCLGKFGFKKKPVFFRYIDAGILFNFRLSGSRPTYTQGLTKKIFLKKYKKKERSRGVGSAQRESSLSKAVVKYDRAWAPHGWVTESC